MKLQNSLYTIVEESHSDEGYEYQIGLNADCEIYKAHFPGQPITPGVCIIQIAQELYELSMKRTTALVAIKNVKFITVMIPEPGKRYMYRFRKIVDDGEFAKFQVVVSLDDTVCAKLSLVCRLR